MLDTLSLTPADLLIRAVATREDSAELDVCFELVQCEYIRPDRSVGEPGGWECTMRLSGAILSYQEGFELALTRDQTLAMTGPARAERMEWMAELDWCEKANIGPDRDDDD